MNTEPKDVLSPIAASVLFGKSTEAVRRAISEGHVESPFALQFGSNVIRMIDLDSAKAYWMRSERPSYLESWSSEVERMRRNGLTVYRSAALGRYRILHPFHLMISGSQAKIPKDQEIS